MMADENSAYVKAQELAAAAKNEAALIAFSEAFRQEPHNFKAVFGTGLMHQRLGEHSQAISAFSQVIGMQPDIAEAYYSKALSEDALGSYDEALHDLDKAIDLNPDFEDALYARGVVMKKRLK